MFYDAKAGFNKDTTEYDTETGLLKNSEKTATLLDNAKEILSDTKDILADSFKDITEKIKDSMGIQTESKGSLDNIYQIGKSIFSSLKSSVSSTLTGQIHGQTNLFDTVDKEIDTNLVKGTLGKFKESTNGIIGKILPKVEKPADDQTSFFDKIDGSHANGLANVPKDGYIAELHKNEMVVPANKADAVRNIIKTGANNSLLNKIYERVNGIFTIINQKNGSPNNKNKANPLVDIKNNTKDIFKELDGQITNVGYNTEYIANILTDVYGPPSMLPKGIRAGVHKIKSIFSKAFGFITKPFKWLGDKFSWITDKFKSVADIVGNAINKIIEIPKAILEFGKSLIHDAIGVVSGLAKTAFGAIKGVLSMIPDVLHSASELLVNSFKVIGEAGVQLAKGLGTAAVETIGAIGEMGKGLIKLGATIIPEFVDGMVKATKSIAGLITGALSSAWNFIKKPFSKKSNKTISNIKHVDEVGIVREITLLNKVKSVGILEKIGDTRLYNKLDTIINGTKNANNDELSNPLVDGVKNSMNHVVAASKNLAESIKDSFDTKLDNRNKQVAEFREDEKAETEERKKSQNEKLQLAANQSQVEMNERNKSSFSSKGIFGILSKALLFIAPGMMAKLAAIKSGGGFTKYFGSKLWLTLKNSTLLKSIGTWISSKITSIGKWVTAKVLPKMALRSATTKATTSAATTIAASGATAAATSKVAGKTGAAVAAGAAGTAAGAASSGKLSKTLTKVASKAKGKGKIVAGTAAGLAALYGGKKIYDSNNVDTVSGYDSDGNAIIDENAYNNDESLTASIGEAYGRSYMNKTAINAVRTKASSSVAKAGLNASLLKSTETVADSGLVKKILTSSAVKKLAGKLGPILSKLSEKLAPKLAKAGAGFFAKLTTKWSLVIGSAGVSGGVIPALWYGGNLLNDISKTNQMFEVPADFKATPLMQLIAGFAGFVTDNITFGLLPSSLICEWIGSWVLSEEELQKISEAKNTLQNNYQNYVNTTGKNITFDAYNETVENRSAFRQTTSRLIQVNTGGVFNNDEISERTGKSEDEITFTDRLKNSGINTKDKFTLNQFNEDEMRKLLGKTNGEAITIADRANVGLGSLVESLTLGAISDESMVKFVGIVQKGVTDAVSGAKDWVTNGFNYMDNQLGTFFGCTDEDGNSIKVSELVATTWNNLKDANSKVMSSIKENAGTIWDGTKDFFSKAVDNYKGAYKWADNMIGAIFNLTDDEGNPLSLTQATKKAAINTFENVKSLAGNVWSGITGTVTKWKDNIVKAADVTNATLGAIFHLEDDEGNPLSFTEWIVSPDGLVDDATRGIKKIASGLWNGVSNWVSDTIKGFTDFAVKKDTELGLLLGCTDDDGNPITFTQGVKRAIGIENSMIAKNVKGFVQNAYGLWNNANNWFTDKVTKFADFGKSKDSELGAYFGCVDENGNPLSFTGYAGMAKDNLMNKISSLPTQVRQLSSQVWGSISNFFNEIKDGISSALNFTNLKIGGVLGLEDDTGNTIGLTDWVKTKKNAITNKVSSTAGGIGSWTKNKLNITDSDITDRLSTDSAGNGKGWITFPSRYGTKNNKSAGNGPATAEDNYNGAVYYRQGDDRWGQMDYGTGSIAASGCGPTSAAMLISSLTGQPITPDETAAWSVANGYRIPNEGTAFDFFPAVAKQYGLELTPTEDYTGSLMDSLRSGYPAILSGAGPAPFTNGGHLLFAVGADPNNSNNVIINDPVNKERSTSYPISNLSGSMMQAWVANKKLTGGVTVSGSSSNNTSNTTATKEKDTSPFLTAISQLGALTSGYIQSAVSGTAFDADAILNTDSTTATNSTGGYTFTGGVLTPPAGMAVGTLGIDAVAPYMSKFASVGNQFGIDPAVMAAIAMQESGGDANLQESAWGLMQIENGDTTDEFINFGKSKYGEDWSSDDRLNPDKAIPFAASRLSGDLSHYNGDYIKTIQAYNFSKYSLDKLIGAFGDDWLSHTGEMAYYNGQYDSTGSTSYGDPQYVPHVLRYYHNNASAGNGEGDNSTNFVKFNNKYIKTKTKTKNTTPVSKFNATDFLLNNTSKISNDVNEYVSTRDVLVKSNNYDSTKLDKIIEILGAIADNTREVADTNAELVTKEYNPNIIVNTKNTDNDTSKSTTNSNTNQSPTLGNISSRGASKQIDDAYNKAILIAKGRYE